LVRSAILVGATLMPVGASSILVGAIVLTNVGATLILVGAIGDSRRCDADCLSVLARSLSVRSF
jgi:hypothetical protein